MRRLSAVQLSHNHKQIENMTHTHTPAPWRKSNISPHIYGPQNEYLAICEDPQNALLIASAPELLAALRGLMNQAAKDAERYAKDGSEPIWAWIADASDIIAKAEGNA